MRVPAGPSLALRRWSGVERSIQFLHSELDPFFAVERSSAL
jgi:hypothetical protein